VCFSDFYLKEGTVSFAAGEGAALRAPLLSRYAFPEIFICAVLK
jgi:hypothetical protein